MKSPDVVFRELGQLYDFNREIAKFRIVPTPRPDSAPARDSLPATPPSHGQPVPRETGEK